MLMSRANRLWRTGFGVDLRTSLSWNNLKTLQSFCSGKGLGGLSLLQCQAPALYGGKLLASLPDGFGTSSCLAGE